MRSLHASLIALSILALPSLSMAQAAPPRPMRLDEVLRIARDRNGDIRAAREHIKQASADVDRAMAALLPTVTAQGKYTHFDRQVELSLGGGPLQTLSGQLQASSLTLEQAAFQDLYTQTGKTPSPAVQQQFQQFGALSMQVANYCTANPGASECSTAPIVIQKQEQLDFFANANVPLIVPAAYVAVKAARQAFIAGERGADATEAQVLVQVAAAFFAAAGNDELVGARQNAVQVAQRTYSDAKARLEAGVVNRVDVQRAQQAVIRAEQALLEQENAQVSAYRGLATLARLDEPVRAVVGELPPPPGQTNRALVDQALHLRPELLQVGLQIQAADNNRLSNRLRWLPTLSGFGLFRAFNAAGFIGQNFSWSVGLQLDWLLYDGGIRDAAARQFESVVREVKLRKEQVEAQIAQDVADTRGQLEVKRHAIDAAEKEIALAADTLELVRAQNQAGTATQLDLLTAQDQLVNARVNLARSHFDLALADVQLRRAIGSLLDSVR